LSRAAAPAPEKTVAATCTSSQLASKFWCHSALQLHHPAAVFPHMLDWKRGISHSAAVKLRLQNSLLVILLASACAATAQVKVADSYQAIHAPRPEYPEQARRERRAGSGVAILTVDPKTGRVTNVTMSPRTGHPILDAAAVTAFREWRFKPGGPAKVRLPVTFTADGTGLLPHIRSGGFGGVPDAMVLSLLAATTPDGKKLSAAEVKPLIVSSPAPPSTLQVVGYVKLRIGVFLLKVRSDGTVSGVEVLQSTGAAIADSEVKNAFKKWRFRPGSVNEVRVPAYYHRSR
jgi:TonB family protein